MIIFCVTWHCQCMPKLYTIGSYIQGDENITIVIRFSGFKYGSVGYLSKWNSSQDKFLRKKKVLCSFKIIASNKHVHTTFINVHAYIPISKKNSELVCVNKIILYGVFHDGKLHIISLLNIKCTYPETSLYFFAPYCNPPWPFLYSILITSNTKSDRRPRNRHLCSLQIQNTTR